MNRLKADQKNKVGKRKLSMEAEESDMEGVKLFKFSGETDLETRYSYPSSSSHQLAQSTLNSMKLPKKYEIILRQFVQWTQANESAAVSYLTKSNWNIEYAMTLYFDNPHLFSGPPTTPAIDQSKVEVLFLQYVDQRDNFGDKRIGPHGISRLLQDLGYSPTDRRVLILAWKFKAQTQCEFSLEEWIQGFTALQTDTIPGLKQKIDSINAEFDADKKSTFREVYNFAYQYAKPVSCRSLDLETSVAYWDVLFGPRCPLMNQWVEFLVNQENTAAAKLEKEMGPNGKRIKSVWITRDTWMLFFDFMVFSKPDLSDYDDEGAWPVLIDQFVDFCRSELGYPKPAGSDAVPMEQPSYY